MGAHCSHPTFCDGICNGARAPHLNQIQSVGQLAMARRIDEMESELRISSSDNRRLKIRCDELESQLNRGQGGQVRDSTSPNAAAYCVADDAHPRTMDDRSTVCSASQHGLNSLDVDKLKHENEQLKCKIRMLARA
eukprot:GEMP01068325.1.p1 GENE.GEMP01068325.1~~GEMP01068325.1.p1  ORF type:complete len:136 (+),score=28.68 GEMP01068325.1:202-609(+)